jgi:hypothetical protein
MQKAIFLAIFLGLLALLSGCLPETTTESASESAGDHVGTSEVNVIDGDWAELNSVCADNRGRIQPIEAEAWRVIQVGEDIAATNRDGQVMLTGTLDQAHLQLSGETRQGLDCTMNLDTGETDCEQRLTCEQELDCTVMDDEREITCVKDLACGTATLACTLQWVRPGLVVR